MNKSLPLPQWFRDYKGSYFKNDLIAGITVGIMLIPQGMAYAMIAGLPPIYGLYASTLPLIIYALLGTSRQLAVGPVAMVSLLVAAGIGDLASGGESYITLAITLAFLVGGIQLLLGLVRMGFLVNFLSHPVISGFTSAAAIIIGFSQVKHLLGVDLPRTEHFHETVVYAIQHLTHTNWVTFLIGISGIGLIIGLKKINKAFPGPIIAVVISILAALYFQLPASFGVAIVGEVPAGLPAFSTPTLDLSTLRSLLPIALAISLVSFMESIAVAKAVQSRHKNYEIDANKELIALGMANIGGGFFQSYPVTGGFSRTAVNDQAGAKSGLSSIISAMLIVLTLLFLTPLFTFLPNAILASIIMVAVAGLIDFGEMKRLWTMDRNDFWMLLVTFLTTLAVGIETGILAGVVLSLAIMIYHTSRPHYAVLGQVPGTKLFRNRERFPDLLDQKETLIIRFDARLYFANVEHFRDVLNTQIENASSELKDVVLSFESVNSIDSSALHMLEEFITDVRKHQLGISICNVKGPVRDKLERAGITQLLGEENFYLTTYDAVNKTSSFTSEEQVSNRDSHYILQHNE
jgi:SulP family sulfate permease